MDGEFQERAGVGAGVELIFPPLEADRDVGLVGGVGGEAGGDPRVGGGKVKGGLRINEKIRVVGADHHNQAEKGFRGSRSACGLRGDLAEERGSGGSGGSFHEGMFQKVCQAVPVRIARGVLDSADRDEGGGHGREKVGGVVGGEGHTLGGSAERGRGAD